ncbi:flagellar basal body P-ring formation chaperone FlgA [Paraburkholderia sp. BL10I2N1]|uniref:flagellar basal body P-ring formation chaperone FlgA n=1 Tax=Paraburkholderia sp. BL10I2N1 TaxID=1938796 RepID=UPI0010622B03|nr:flagellar basal body P-ring formation chaperone FlgA [Paraburkholderia sp. BL10I2N1]TDN67961.1 flagella basal body P-ring formation protein FlgA [Paraburkholderia sp. BL10I2N1]
MALSASEVPRTARRARAGAARTLAAWAMFAIGGVAIVLPVSTRAQEAGGPIVIPGPAEKNPAALAALAERVNAPAAVAAPPAAPAAMQVPVAAPSAGERNNGDRFASAAKADGAIVIPGAGEAAAPVQQPALTRVSQQTATRQVLPVVVAPARAGGLQPAAAQSVAMNQPDGSGASLDPLASRGEPPQLRSGSNSGTNSGSNTGVPANDIGRVVPAAQVRLQAQAQQGSVASQPVAQPVQPAPAGQQDAESIRRAALAFLQQQAAGLPGKIDITVAPVFPRGLAACTALAPFMPTGTRLWGRTTVGVRCAGEHPWTLYLQARIALHATYYLASRAIAPGEMLTAADLVARDGDLTNMPQAIVTDPSQAVGSVALMRVAAGLPLRQDMLRSASSVTIGQTVRVVAQGPGFAISSEGSAMNNAAPGQPVRVKTAAGQIIQGVVKDGGTVEIQL